MVRLEGDADVAACTMIHRFNSTMVRLEAGGTATHRAGIPEFQFHDGAIRSVVEGGAGFEPACFNSTMVRLEEADSFRTSARSLFQFHDGAIRSRPF